MGRTGTGCVAQPTYYRPAKRAGASPQREGTVLSIKRFDQAAWKPVPTARVAEGDAELQQIIGLKMHEFTKVILLPQGAFAKLLHASNEERRAILEQLFDTGTYERLEGLLWEQMRQAESELKDVDSQIQARGRLGCAQRSRSAARDPGRRVGARRDAGPQRCGGPARPHPAVRARRR